MKYVLDDFTLENFVEYGVNVWGIDKSLEKYKIAYESIERTRDYFIELGLPSTLSELGIEESKLEEMAKQAARFGDVGNFKPLNAKDIFNIFESAF